MTRPALAPALSTGGLSRVRTTIVCLALFLEGMSSSSINVQIAEIREALGPSAVELALIASGFLISFAGLLPLAGQWVDHGDRRRVFLLGVGLFGLASVVCALAPGAGVLIGGRFAQGAGAALSAPAALALITAGIGKGIRRNRAVALYGAMGAAGFSTGLVVPGVVVTWVGWRASFLVLVPIVVLVLAASWRLPVPVRIRKGTFDVVGGIALTVVLAVAIGLIGGLGDPNPRTLTIGAVVLAVVTAGLVFRGGVGGFPLEVFVAPRVLGAGIALGSVFAGVLSSMYVLSLWLQERQDIDAFMVGLLILPQPLAFALAASTGAKLTGRLGSGRTLAAGIAVTASSLLGLAVVGADHVPAVLVAMAGVGVGMALCFPAASITAIDAAPEELRGTAASLLTTAQNIGGAIGLALVTAAGLVPGASGPGIGRGMIAAALMLVLGGGLAAFASRRRHSVAGGARIA